MHRWLLPAHDEVSISEWMDSLSAKQNLNRSDNGVQHSELLTFWTSLSGIPKKNYAPQS
jgi:hypothetical protein